VSQLRITNGQVFTDGVLIPADLVVDDGKIAGIVAPGQAPSADQTLDADGLVVLPGLVDTHAHFREPGYTYKEDFLSGSRAAAAGGITMFVDQPNVEPPPSTLELYQEHRRLAEASAVVDFNHWGMPTKLAEIPKIAEAGAVGFKFFMKSAHYPYDGDISLINHASIMEAFRAIAPTGRLCTVHPHNQDIWEYQTAERTRQGRTSVKDWAEVTYGDEDVIETTAISLLAILANAVGCRLRIQHIQGRPQNRVVRMLKQAGFRFLTEANPWGVFWIEPIGIQTPEDLEDNWTALQDGTIDVIASDHAPHTREEQAKVGDNSFQSVIAAYPLCEHYLSMYLTEVNRGRISLAQLVWLVSENAARHIGVYPRKGTIRVGSDADLALVDMQKRAVLGESYPVYSKMGFTPLHGKEVQGVPVYTVVRGRIVMEHGQIVAEPGSGQFIHPLTAASWGGPYPSSVRR
jgi:dihydroorotase-like cyclic amidohydrolase